MEYHFEVWNIIKQVRNSKSFSLIRSLTPLSTMLCSKSALNVVKRANENHLDVFRATEGTHFGIY